MSKRDRIFKIIILIMSILEMALTPFVSHDFLTLVCIMGWFNVMLSQLSDLLDD